MLDWKSYAACRGLTADPKDTTDVFFGGDDQLAKQICAVCPVTEPCLDFALANHIPDGVFGGMTERERVQHAGRCKGRRTRGENPVLVGAAIFNTANAIAPQQQTASELLDQIANRILEKLNVP